ncbi:hypothetical protein HDU98_006071 [Podochytrium sp. JEL0797]|nr:hypothetical protein HDU98_006071 [Podochytrium sp. JEL0797]
MTSGAKEGSTASPSSSAQPDFVALALSKEPLRWTPHSGGRALAPQNTAVPNTATPLSPRIAPQSPRASNNSPHAAAPSHSLRRAPPSAQQNAPLPSQSFSYQPSGQWIPSGWGAAASQTPSLPNEWRNPNSPTQLHSPEWGPPPQDDEWINSTNNNFNSLPNLTENLYISSPQLQTPLIPVPVPSADPPPQSPPPPFEMVGNGRWKVLELIGAGSFGEVFAAVDLETEKHVAIKRELSNTRRQQLPHEYAVYELLRRSDGFPRIYHSGTEGPYNILVMERLGPSLKELEKRSPTLTIPLRTMVRIVPQMIRRVQALHELGIVFRDIKPDQFCIGRYSDDLSDRPTVFLIDFGLATAFRDATGKHVKNAKPVKNAPKTGTARYASLNVHKGKCHSRRDDLESLAYLVVEAVKGPLPWTGIKAVTSTDGWRKIGICKDDTLPAELCADLPPEFALLLEHARELRFADTPDYGMLVNAFVDLLMRIEGEEGAGYGRLEWECVREGGDDGYGDGVDGGGV